MTPTPARHWSRHPVVGWVALFLALASFGCGYRLAGGSATLPAHVKKIAIPVFENRTQQPDIAQRLTERVVDEFISRGGLVATSEPEGADALLRGVVTQYRSVPVVIDSDGLATRYEIQIQIEAELLDLSNEEVLWEDDHFIFRSQFDVDANSSLFFDRSIIGIQRVSEEAARSIVATILDGF